MSKNADRDYSYLDYCVLPHLREWVLAVEPVVLFDSSMERILWSNAAAATFFGSTGIAEMLQTRPSESQPLIKQIKSAVHQIEGDFPLQRGFRVVRGMRSQLIDCTLRALVLPNGEKSYLFIATPDDPDIETSENQIARSVVNSLKGFATAAAVADDAGLTLAATRSFARVDLEQDTLTEMIGKVIKEADRLVKSPVEALDGSGYAVGIARISNSPGRNLMVLVGTDEVNEAYSGNRRHNRPNDALATNLDKQQEGSKPSGAASNPATANVPISQTTEELSDIQDITQTNRINLLQRRWQLTPYVSPFAASGTAIVEVEETDPGVGERADPVEANKTNSATLLQSDADNGSDTAAHEVSSTEETAFRDSDATMEIPSELSDDGGLSQEPAVTDNRNTAVASDEDQKESEPDAPAIQRQKTNVHGDEVELPFTYEEQDEAVRFAWTINAEQIFVSVSPEFAQTVGPKAADVIGRKWSDVAAVFGFDTSGAIAELLSKKDTWSGKSVLWPVQGTDILVPIDLAALPAFDADRTFEGFKGFGIIRTEDAILDPDSVGLALSSSATIQDLANEPDHSSDEATSDKNEDEPPIRQSLPDDDEDAAFIGNVVDLVSRLPATDGDVEPPRKEENLTLRENEYFNEIGERLRETADSDWEAGIEDIDDGENEVIAPSGVVAKPVPIDPIDEKTEPSIEGGLGPTGKAPDTDDGMDNSILNELPVPVLIYKNGDTLFANTQLLELTQFKSVEEIANIGGIDGLLKSVERIGEANNHRLLKKDGSIIAVNPILRSVPWNNERAIMVTFKIAEPEEARRDIQLPDADVISEMQDILDTATDGIIVLDEEGVVKSFNGSAEALFGTSSAEIVGTHIETLFAIESRATLSRYLKSMSERRSNAIFNDGCEVIGREANGGLIPLFITLGKIGESDKLCLVIRDMTSWKKSEEDLVNAKRQAEKASDQKSDFLARVSHEIRTPLNAIIGFSDVMIEERFGPIGNDRYKDYLLDINRSGVHVLDLINDLLDLSKIESGKIDLSFEAVDLNQIVSETVALMQPQANSNRIIIRTSLSRVVPKVVADARSMRQIIMNLVSNAIKFSQANGQVIVSTVYEGNGEVALRIRDTGVGMTDDELKDAMKPFYQIPGVSEKSGKGTGLGLPLTKALVEANRAHFDLESQLNQGTIAHVQFPTQRVLAD